MIRHKVSHYRTASKRYDIADIWSLQIHTSLQVRMCSKSVTSHTAGKCGAQKALKLQRWEGHCVQRLKLWSVKLCMLWFCGGIMMNHRCKVICGSTCWKALKFTILMLMEMFSKTVLPQMQKVQWSVLSALSYKFSIWRTSENIS